MGNHVWLIKVTIHFVELLFTVLKSFNNNFA